MGKTSADTKAVLLQLARVVQDNELSPEKLEAIRKALNGDK